jgi:hypothetical protein
MKLMLTALFADFALRFASGDECSGCILLPWIGGG